MVKIPERWSNRRRGLSGRRTTPVPSSSRENTSRSSKISKQEKKPASESRKPSMDIIEGINRWLPYIPVGRRIPGTRLIAFKVPLKMAYVRRLEPRDQFTVDVLLDLVPDLGLVIDLTQTDRYYNKQDLLERGVLYCKIACPGQRIPPEDLVLRFFSAIDYYLDHHPQDNTVIGIHCTHGVNRTGYMIARYLTQRLGIPIREAIMCINTARNHKIERKQYVDELERHTNLVPKDSSNKDIQFSRMRPGVSGGIPPARVAASPPQATSGPPRMEHLQLRPEYQINVRTRHLE